MGEGLKRVAKHCGGITVKNKDKTVEYDENSKKIKTTKNKKKKRLETFENFVQKLNEMIVGGSHFHYGDYIKVIKGEQNKIGLTGKVTNPSLNMRDEGWIGVELDEKGIFPDDKIDVHQSDVKLIEDDIPSGKDLLKRAWDMGRKK